MAVKGNKSNHYQDIAPQDQKARENWYREMGWWQGERLEKRYQNIVDQHPKNLAVVDNHGGELTHQQLWDLAGDMAKDLATHGIKKGDRVLIVFPNRAHWQVVFLAALRLQAIPASIPVTMDEHNLAHAIDLIKCRLVITTGKHGSQDLEATCLSAVNQSQCKPGLLSVSQDGSGSWKCDPEGNQPALPTTSAEIDHIAFTSSTTGHPKAVLHSIDTFSALNQTFTERFDLGLNTPIFMASPLGHSVGSYHGARLALFTGTTLVLQDKWDPQQALQMIEHYGCGFTAAATPFLQDLVNASWQGSAPKLSTMTSFLCGGAPVPPILLEKAQKEFPNTFITNLWGMTEGGLVTCTKDSPHSKVISTAGIGLPGLELRTIDEAGASLAPNEEGELVMRGPGVFFGYAGQDDLYNESITEEGFFRTGDLARIDEQGYVQITGRLKDLIVRGGVNISPIPIEDVLAKHPQVDSVAVVGFPDERLGERICAVIQAKDVRPTQEDLVQFSMDNGLSKRYCPELVRYVNSMPRTAGGKIRKADLQKIVIENNPNLVSS